MPPPDKVAGYGVFHTAELPYTWDNLHTRGWPWQPADRRLAEAMADAWARFIRAGDPNGGGLPHWPALAAGAEHAVMRFGDVPALAEPARLAALHLLDPPVID